MNKLLILERKETERLGDTQIFIAIAICNQLRIPYVKLTKEEFMALIEILKKSSHMKSLSNQRGKTKPYRVRGNGKRKNKRGV